MTGVTSGHIKMPRVEKRVHVNGIGSFLRWVHLQAPPPHDATQAETLFYAVTSRYKKTGTNYLAVVHIACMFARLNEGHFIKLVFSPFKEPMKKHRIFTTSFASVYPLYVQKAEGKGRKKQEVDDVICWLTGYSPKALAQQLAANRDFETFFSEAPALNPNVGKITGVICGVRIEDIEDPLMRNIRYLDKLVDELAKGRPMEKILRK